MPEDNRAIELAAEAYRLLMELMLTRKGPGTADTPTPQPTVRQRLQLIRKQRSAA